MNQGKQLRIIIGSDGKCSIEALNFTNATCTQATKQIMQMLGGQVTQEHLKPEAQRLPPLARGNIQAEGAR
jgi:hypothetical protein